MKFIYSGNDKNNSTKHGTIIATNKIQAEELLIQQGITVTNLETEEQESLISKLNFFNYPNINDLIIFTKQMHSLLRAGVPIIRAINILSDSCKNKRLATTLTKIATRLEAGHSFASSMEKYPKIFPTIVRSLVNIGEQTGTLAGIFERISINLNKENSIKRGVKSAMRYPLLVVISLIAALFIINIFVIPSFAKFFKEMKAELPVPTKILIIISDFTVKHGWLILGSIFLIVLAFINFIHTDKGRFIWDRYKIKIPIIGSILERSLLASFARSFALCFRSGVPLLEALGLISNTCDNAYIETRIMKMKENIEHGESMTIAAKNSKIFNALVLQMILIGEESGELDRLLEEISLFYDEELNYDIKQLSSLIEPILIAMMSVLVLILALGIFLPMWSLAQTATGT